MLIKSMKRLPTPFIVVLEILERLDRLNAAGKIHPTRVGIGLHMGEAVTGNVGSTERKEYTIIGDVVNLASRLEKATK
jgi:adenylate cyclase